MYDSIFILFTLKLTHLGYFQFFVLVGTVQAFVSQLDGKISDRELKNMPQ